MLLLLTAGCYLPTAYGLRDDGLLPSGPEVTAQVAQSGLFVASTGAYQWYGAQGRFRLGPKVGLRINGAMLPFPSDSGLVVANAEADVLVGFAREPEHAFTGTLSFGLSTLLLANAQEVELAPGLDVGVTFSKTVAHTLHPFAGVRVNPVSSFYTNDAGVWIHTGGGLSWRPPLGRAVEGIFAIEGGWDHGFAACVQYTRSEDGIGIAPDACDTWSLGLSAGATFGKQAE